jgi:hypothetical protein
MFYVGGAANAWRFGVQQFLMFESVKYLVLIFVIPNTWKILSLEGASNVALRA